MKKQSDTEFLRESEVKMKKVKHGYEITPTDDYVVATKEHIPTVSLWAGLVFLVGLIVGFLVSRL
jgi:hypothetical protein